MATEEDAQTVSADEPGHTSTESGKHVENKDEDAQEKLAVETFMKGKSYLDAGNANAAAPCFMKAASMLPGWPDAWLQLGMCLHHLRQYQQACNATRHAIEVSRWEDPGSILTYIDMLRDLGRLNDMVAAARRFPLDSPLSHFAALLTGWAVHASDGAQAAHHWFTQASTMEPGCVLYSFLAAQAAEGGSLVFEPGALALESAADDDKLFVQLHRAQHHLDSPSLWLLNDKVELHRLLKAAPGSSTFWPPGFVLPAEHELAEQAEAMLPGLDGAGNTPQWVLKTRAGMGGSGITVHKSVNDLDQGHDKLGEEECLLQAYVSRPVLLEGRKFSLRAFLVLYLGGGSDKPTGYVAREGLCLMAPRPWEQDNLERDIHVTNQSASQLCAPGESLTRDAQDVADADLAGWEGGQKTLWEAVTNVAAGLLAASSEALMKPVGEFQPRCGVLVPKILGLDLLLSAASPSGEPQRAWLLEVNRHPSLGERYECARLVKRKVTLAAWTLLWQGRSRDLSTGTGSVPIMWPVTHDCLQRLD